jgi:hypothetical protein
MSISYNDLDFKVSTKNTKEYNNFILNILRFSFYTGLVFNLWQKWLGLVRQYVVYK